MSKGLRAAAVAAGLVAAAAAGSGPAGAKTAAPCSPSGTSLELTAENHKFDKDCLAVTAGESFTIRFDNRDNDRHNVAVLPAHTAAEAQFAGDIVAGPKSIVYAVPNMKAGTFHFHCEVHPNLMNGTFVVASAPSAAPPAATPTTAAGPKAAAAAPAPAPAVPKASPTTTTTGRPAAAAPAEPAAAATGTKLPRTGPASRLALLLAGLALAAGGLSVLGGAQPRA